MTIRELLEKFYSDNGLPIYGGSEQYTFLLTVFGLKLYVPNFKFRKKALYIYDVEHILNNCDTSWKGEAFIAGWEISTGMWRHIPLAFLSLWAMGYSLWLHPKQVFYGFKTGLNFIGIIDLTINKEDLLNLHYYELENLLRKDTTVSMGLLQWCIFLFWCFIGEFVFLLPLLSIVTIWFLLAI